VEPTVRAEFKAGSKPTRLFSKLSLAATRRHADYRHRAKSAALPTFCWPQRSIWPMGFCSRYSGPVGGDVHLRRAGTNHPRLSGVGSPRYREPAYRSLARMMHQVSAWGARHRDQRRRQRRQHRHLTTRGAEFNPAFPYSACLAFLCEFVPIVGPVIVAIPCSFRGGEYGALVNSFSRFSRPVCPTS